MVLNVSVKIRDVIVQDLSSAEMKFLPIMQLSLLPTFNLCLNQKHGMEAKASMIPLGETELNELPKFKTRAAT